MWSAARPSVIGNGYLAGAGSTGPAGFAISASCRTEGPHRRKADPVFRFRRCALQEGEHRLDPKRHIHFWIRCCSFEMARFRRAFSFPVRQPGFRLRVDRM
jgi:hypothetical protein